MKDSFYPDCQKGHPNRRPEWRWARAWELFNDGKYYVPGRDDVATGRALSYIRAEFGTTTRWYRNKQLRCLGDVAAAHQIHGGLSGVRLEIEARILARQTAQEISRRVGFSAEVIVAYESLFFNVSDRLDATTYITTLVIGEIVPEGAAKPDFARLIKWTAYNGGVGPLDAMLQYVARKSELDLLGKSSIALSPATQLAIDAFVAIHSLAITEATVLDVATKGGIVQEIIESRPRKTLLSDHFAAQTASALESLAIKATPTPDQALTGAKVDSEAEDAA